jgi:hypothetical protein
VFLICVQLSSLSFVLPSLTTSDLMISDKFSSYRRRIRLWQLAVRNDEELLGGLSIAQGGVLLPKTKADAGAFGTGARITKSRLPSYCHNNLVFENNL